MRYAANSDRTVLPRAWTGERRFLGGGSAERVAGDLRLQRTALLHEDLDEAAAHHQC
jgi:hypothetical protein